MTDVGTSCHAAYTEERGSSCDAQCGNCGTLRNQVDPDGDAIMVLLASEEVRLGVVPELHQVCC